MTLSRASQKPTQGKNHQQNPISAEHVPGAKMPGARPEHTQVPVTPLPARQLSAVLPGSRHKAALRRRWKRACLRRSLHKAACRNREAILFTALNTAIPLWLLVTVLGSLAGMGWLYYHSEQNALASIANALPGDSLKIYDSQGNLIDELTDQGSQTTVTLDQISPNLIHATVAIEDKDFWTNEGVDFLAIARAAADDLSTGGIVSGASTITQQLIKNALVGPEVTLDRKLREVILALGLTHELSKQDILTLYLNTIYYGEQAYGIDAAAHAYFSLQDQPNRPAATQLDLAQASLLAGLPQAPSQLDPLINRQAALNRQQAVLRQMIIQGYITTQQALQAEREAQQPGFLKPDGPSPNLAPHFSSYVLNELQTLINQHVISTADLSRSGLRVYTTLNLSLQNQILQIARQHVQAMAVAHHMSNAAEVLIDYHTGAILTLLGSIEYNDSSISGQFDVATQGYRQSGSSFKPFVYATAFEKGWSPGTAISDTPLTIAPPPDSNEPPYSPQNYDHKFHGEVTIRYALQNSFNVPAVRTVMFAGVQNSLVTAEEMGITSYTGVPGPSMVLGGLNIRLIDETSAYGVFANGGVRMPPFAIQRITDQQGKVIYQHQLHAQKVISPLVAGLITNTLSDDRSRQYEFGVCSPLMLYDGTPYSPACQRGATGAVRPSAAKTGTTQDFRDNWTVGYTTDFVMGVWAGNNNGDPMVDVSGVDGAAPIWHDSMLVAEQGRPIQNFSLPHGLIRARVTYPDGLTSTDWYLPGTVPPGSTILGKS
jgi:membrane peptidoglycan carboxypeptidase